MKPRRFVLAMFLVCTALPATAQNTKGPQSVRPAETPQQEQARLVAHCSRIDVCNSLVASNDRRAQYVLACIQVIVMDVREPEQRRPPQRQADYAKALADCNTAMQQLARR